MDFLVDRKDIRETRIEESEPPELEAGQALLEVDSFGLTANNVTYAVFGDAMSYWDFFPAPEGWGRVPVWGFADVSESRAEGLESGTRVYGYLPPSSHLVVTPAADPQRVRDRTEHRRSLPSRLPALRARRRGPLLPRGHRGRCRWCCARCSPPRS